MNKARAKTETIPSNKGPLKRKEPLAKDILDDYSIRLSEKKKSHSFRSQPK